MEIANFLNRKAMNGVAIEKNKDARIPEIICLHWKVLKMRKKPIIPQ
jgi:hypothetical protein